MGFVEVISNNLSGVYLLVRIQVSVPRLRPQKWKAESCFKAVFVRMSRTTRGSHRGEGQGRLQKRDRTLLFCFWSKTTTSVTTLVLYVWSQTTTSLRTMLLTVTDHILQHFWRLSSWLLLAKDPTYMKTLLLTVYSLLLIIFDEFVVDCLWSEIQYL